MYERRHGLHLSLYNITFYGRLTGKTHLLECYTRASHKMIDFGGNINGHHIK